MFIDFIIDILIFFVEQNSMGVQMNSQNEDNTEYVNAVKE